MHRALLTLGLLAFGATGCGTALDYIPTRESPHQLQGRSPEQVEVFMTGQPDRPYLELGMIESQEESLSLDTADVIIQKMRRFAGELGCDAIVIFAGNDATVSSGMSPTYVDTRKGYRGSCLVYTKEKMKPAPAAVAAAACLPNSTQLCYGPGGCKGGQSCAADGKSYTPCDCGTAQPPAASAAASPAAQPSAAGQAAASPRR